MKLTKDQQRWLDHLLANAGVARGYTLGRGRPHDERVLKSLISSNWIQPLFPSRPAQQNEYAVREAKEDANGLALLVHPCTGDVTGAVHYGVRVRPFTDDDYAQDVSGSAYQNGVETAWELYPRDEVRRYWMEWAAARSTLCMYS